MTFIRNIAAHFATKSISVDIDSELLSDLDTSDKRTELREVTFNLYNLIYHIGAIQSRRFAPSNRLKFEDKADLIEKICSNTNEFRVKIDEIRTINGTETLNSISEDFGVGISVVIAESLFKIKRSTIQKIYGTGKRPDWKCQTADNRILVVECKGSISLRTSLQQEVTALQQKTKEPGDIQVASLTVLNEDSISTNRFLDPPIENSNISPIMENHILRAGHYASVFSFFGNSKLSKYYSQMRKRLYGRLSPIEQEEKDYTFNELRTSEPTINFNNKEFVGSFYEVDNGKHLFVGVDKELLSYTGFIKFNDYDDDTDTLVEGNHYLLFKDGVLIIEIEKIQVFSNIVEIETIQNYQNKITISDIDEMNEISFSKYFAQLIKRNGFTNIREEIKLGDNRIDLAADFNSITYYFEFKIKKNAKVNIDSIKSEYSYGKNSYKKRFILVTNGKINHLNSDNLGYTIIDRNGLKKIASNYKNLIKLIDEIE